LRLRAKIKKEKYEPIVPLHIYNLNDVMTILQNNNCHKCFVRFSDHGSRGVVVFFQKVEINSY
jgi:hypothetical protein